MKCIRGEWIKPNKFIDEKGNKIEVLPYGMTIDIIRDLLPMKCFLLLKEYNIIVNWIEV